MEADALAIETHAQTRTISRAARRTADRARRKRTKAWTSPTANQPVFTAVDEISQPRVVDFLALGSDEDAPKKKTGPAGLKKKNASFAPTNHKNTKSTTAEKSIASKERKTTKKCSFASPPLADATNRRQQVDCGTPDLLPKRHMPAAATPAAQSRDKRKAQTPLSVRSEACSSPEPSPLNTLIARMSQASLTADTDAENEPSLAASPAPSMSPGSAVGDACSPLATGHPDTPLSSRGNKSSGSAADSELSARKGKNRGSRLSRLSSGVKLRQKSGIMLGFCKGQCLSPATFLRQRPYGVYRGLTPGKSPALQSDWSNHDSEWEADPQAGDCSESDFWEADGDSNDEAAADSEQEDGNGYATDGSVKSGKWCRSLRERIEAAGLTPKNPKVAGPRPAHLRYVQSYAEDYVEGESDASEYGPRDHESESDDWSDSDKSE